MEAEMDRTGRWDLDEEYGGVRAVGGLIEWFRKDLHVVIADRAGRWVE